MRTKVKGGSFGGSEVLGAHDETERGMGVEKGRDWGCMMERRGGGEGRGGDEGEGKELHVPRGK